MYLLKYPTKINFIAIAITLLHSNIANATNTIISSNTVGGQNFFTGTNSIQINNNITLSASNQNAIYVGGGSLSILNYGTISTNYYVIQNQGTISSLINEGTITSSSGILNIGTIGTLTNTGEISPYIKNQGFMTTPIINTLNNLQGGAPATTALNYIGALPTNYNIIIKNQANYGELSVSSATGPMAFNIYGNTGTTLVGDVATSTVSAGTYADVLQGFSSLSGITGTTGTYSGMSYSLVADTGHSNMWNLVLLSLSTNIFSGTYQSSNLGNSVNPKFDGGTLQVSSAGTISTPLSITSNNGTIDQKGLVSDFTGAITNDSAGATGKLFITNTGTASQGSVTLSGVNTYTGGTQVNAGANLIIHSSSALGVGTLALVGSATVPATLSTTATTTIANAITVEGDPVFNVASGTTTTISGSITDGGSPGDVVVSGGGTLALTAVNTYTGPTMIDSGSTMALSGLGAIATSSAVSNNGTFNLTGKTNSVALSGSYTQASTGALAMNFTSTNNQQLNIAGAANLNGLLSLSASSGSYRAGGRYALLTSSGLTGAFSSFTTDLSSYTRLGYALTYNANDVYLVFTPNVADTQASLGFSANALRGVFNLQSAAINNGLNYDCTVFEKHGICLSAGGRYTNVGDTPSNTTAGLVIGSYKLNQQIRIGGYLDQDISMNTSNGIKLGNNVPLMGLFGVWSQNNTGEGYEVRVAAGYGDKDLTVTRNLMGTSEAGMGTSLVKTHAASGVLSFGQRVSEQWIASPYAGIRYTIISRNGYTESTSTDVTSPLAYNTLNQESTTAMAGLRLTGKVHPKATIVASAGFESDLHHNVGNYSATGLTGLNAVAFNANVNDTRPVASSGIFYDITKAQRVGASFVYRQEAFQSTDTKSVFVSYQVGF